MTERSSRITSRVLATLLAIASCLTGATTASAQSPLPRGVFAGDVIQRPPASTAYSARVTLRSGRLRGGRVGGTIRYPELGCGGNLQYLKRRGSGYFFREILTYGRTTCIDRGTVRLKPQDGGVYFSWTKAYSSIVAFGQLFRP